MKLTCILVLILFIHCGESILTQHRLDQLNKDPSGGNSTGTSLNGQDFANKYAIDWSVHSDGILVTFNDTANTTTTRQLYDPLTNTAILEWPFTMQITTTPSLIPPTIYNQVQSNINGYCKANSNDSSALDTFATVSIALNYCGMIDQSNTTGASPVNYTVSIQFHWNITATSGNYTDLRTITIRANNVAFNKFTPRINAVINNDLDNYQAPTSNLSISVIIPLMSESPSFTNMGDITQLTLDYQSNVISKQTSGSFLTFVDSYNNLTTLIIKNGIFDLTASDYEQGASFISMTDTSFQNIDLSLINVQVDAMSDVTNLMPYNLIMPNLKWKSVKIMNSEFLANPGSIPFVLSGLNSLGNLLMTNNQFLNINAQMYFYSASATITNNLFYNISSQGDVSLFFDQPPGSTGPYIIHDNVMRTSISNPLACYYFVVPPVGAYSVINNMCKPVISTYTPANFGILYKSTVDCLRADFHELWSDNNNTIILATRYNTFCQSTTGISDGCGKFCTPFTSKPASCFVDVSLSTDSDFYGWNTFPSLGDVASYCTTVTLLNDDQIFDAVTLNNPSLNITSPVGTPFTLSIHNTLTLNGSSFSFNNIHLINPDPELAEQQLIMFTSQLTKLIVDSSIIDGFTGGLTQVNFNCDAAINCQFKLSNTLIKSCNETLFVLVDQSSTSTGLQTILSGNTYANVSGSILDATTIPNLMVINNACSGYCLCDPAYGCTSYALIVARMKSSTNQTITITGNSFDNVGQVDFYDKFSTYSPFWINGPLDVSTVTHIYDNSCYGFPVCMRLTNLISENWLSNTQPGGRVQAITNSSDINSFMREWLFYNTDSSGLLVDMYIVEPQIQQYHIEDRSVQCTNYCINSAGDIYCLVTNQVYPSEPFAYSSVQDAVTNCPLIKSGIITIKLDHNDTVYTATVTSNPRSIQTIQFEPYYSVVSIDLHLNNLFSGLTLTNIILPNGLPDDSNLSAFTIVSSTLTGDYTSDHESKFTLMLSVFNGKLTLNDGVGPIKLTDSTVMGGIHIASANNITLTSNSVSCVGVCFVASGSTGSIVANTFTVTNNSGTSLPRPGIGLYGTSSDATFSVSGNTLIGSARVGILISIPESSTITTDGNATAYASSISTSNSIVGNVYDVVVIYNGGTVVCNGNCGGISTSSLYQNAWILIAIVIIVYLISYLVVIKCGIFEILGGNKDYARKMKIAAEFRMVTKEHQVMEDVKQLQQASKSRKQVVKY